MTPQDIEDGLRLLSERNKIDHTLKGIATPLELNWLAELGGHQSNLPDLKGEEADRVTDRIADLRYLLSMGRDFNRPPARPTGPIQPLPPTPLGYTPERALQEARFPNADEAVRAILNLPNEVRFERVAMKPFEPAKMGFWASLKDSIFNWRQRRAENKRRALLDLIYREVGMARARAKSGSLTESEIARLIAGFQEKLDRGGYNMTVDQVVRGFTRPPISDSHLDDVPDDIALLLAKLDGKEKPE